MSALDSTTLYKIAKEMETMRPEGQDLVRTALPQVTRLRTTSTIPESLTPMAAHIPVDAAVESAANPSVASTRDENPPSDSPDSRPTGAGWKESVNRLVSAPRLEETPTLMELLAEINEGKAARRSWKVSKPKLNLPISPSLRYWSFTAACCVCTTIAVFSATHSWHTRLESQRWTYAASVFKADPEPAFDGTLTAVPDSPQAGTVIHESPAVLPMASPPLESARRTSFAPAASKPLRVNAKKPRTAARRMSRSRWRRARVSGSRRAGYRRTSRAFRSRPTVSRI